MNSTILKKDATGVKEVHIEALELNNNIIWITNEINDETAISFIRQLTMLCLEPNEDPIKIMINTNGGSVSSGLAMYDAMIGCDRPIYTCAVGKAYSMGAIILLAGEKRYCLQNSKIMVHSPLVKQVSGNDKEMGQLVKILKEEHNRLNEILSERTGQTIKTIQKATSYDHYFEAKEAKEFHLINDTITLSQFINMKEGECL